MNEEKEFVFHKYKKIRQFGHEENKDILSDPEDEIVIEEKIDGGNFRFFIKDEQIIFGSRTQELDVDNIENKKNLKNFRRCIDFIKDKLKDKDLKLLENKIFYGECCVKHTMNYDWENIPPFLGFDIYCLENELFLARKDLLFYGMGLPTVPMIDKIKAKQLDSLTDKDVPISAFASPSSKDQQAEGIVLKNYSKQIMAKYVRDAFKEKNAEAFGGNPKYNKSDYTDNEIILFKYCTNPRIDKIIFKMVDEGHKLDLPMMKDLPKRLWEDIAEEEWQEIMYSKWIIDFGKLRKLMTKRCLAVLKQVLVNNGLNKK